MNSQSTSFIPQRPTSGKPKARRVRKIYVLGIFAYAIFFGTALAVGVVFFYTLSLHKALDREQTLLSQEKSKFSESDIMSVQEMQKRLDAAKERLNDHVSVVSIFNALERSALNSIQFDSFDYERTTNGAPTVTFVGNTDKFDNIIFQREVMQSNPIFSSVVFSNIALNSRSLSNSDGAQIPGGQEQIITFNMESTIPTSLIPYQPQGNTAPGGETNGISAQSSEGMSSISVASDTAAQNSRDAAATSTDTQ